MFDETILVNVTKNGESDSYTQYTGLSQKAVETVVGEVMTVLEASITTPNLDAVKRLVKRTIYRGVNRSGFTTMYSIQTAADTDQITGTLIGLTTMGDLAE